MKAKYLPIGHVILISKEGHSSMLLLEYLSKFPKAISSIKDRETIVGTIFEIGFELDFPEKEIKKLVQYINLNQ